MVDPMSRVTQYVHDGDGNVVRTIAPNLTTGGAGDSATTTFDTFDLDNERVGETTPNGATTVWQFDDLGRMVRETLPVPAAGQAAPVWQYQYDADSELTGVTDPLNRQQTSTFNGLGQMTSQVSFTGQETDWTYDALSHVLTSTLVAAAGSGLSNETTTNTWDALGRETATQTAAGTATMAFDLAGNMTSLTDPDQNTTSWVYDLLNRATSEENALSYTKTLAYDANSNLVKEVDFDGPERDFT